MNLLYEPRCRCTWFTSFSMCISTILQGSPHVINSGASSTYMFRVRANIDTGRLGVPPSISGQRPSYPARSSSVLPMPPMEEDPTGVRAALRIVRRAFGMVCDQWSSLLPVVVGIFLLNLALTLFMVVNLASPLADLHVMRPFYDIDQANLTAGVTTAAADTVTCSMVAAPGGGAHGHGAASPMWELHLTGELFWSLSMAVAMFSFSRVCRLQRTPLHCLNTLLPISGCVEN